MLIHLTPLVTECPPQVIIHLSIHGGLPISVRPLTKAQHGQWASHVNIKDATLLLHQSQPTTKTTTTKRCHRARTTLHVDSFSRSWTDFTASSLNMCATFVVNQRCCWLPKTKKKTPLFRADGRCRSSSRGDVGPLEPQLTVIQQN